ncbi:LuxR C-terminal-related transcriptional regulator [Actinoallomurus spadix]|uniref:LuxR family transcriptional regulator n=1 Tax=Actinoallomurus spadix TaxID=79912 RepID=A0ABP3H470_9ACTN|nr:LuxR family transcriptional regulator [Actinoallomurus spadix]MCO5988723.1 LuxR C-terminal-related transcriptional regulator [Actinoallomurus spadix]
MWSPLPFVGRGAQLDTVRSLLTDGAARGVVIAGAPGVGKTRLMAEAIAELDPARFTALRAQATLAASALPYGAFAHLLPAGPGPDGDSGGEHLLGPADGPGWAADALLARSGRTTPVVAVDDAHRLDPASAALVTEVVARGSRLLATVRSGEDVPAHVRRLWRDGPVPSLALGPLSAADTARMLAHCVRGQVEAATSRRLWRITEGNPLFLRELVLAGALTERRGVWRQRGDLPVAPRLSELIGGRIGEVDEEERAVLELVAFGEPVGLDLLTGLTSPAAVRRVVDRELVVVVTDRRRRLARPAHPLYGEVIRARTGGLRARNRLRALAEATEATGLRRRHDVPRVAGWRLRSDSVTGAAPMAAACRLAWAAYDVDLAVRLGRAALAAGGGVDAAVLLGTVLHFADRPGEAEAALRRAADEAGTDRERALVAAARARVLHGGLGRAAEAHQVLDAAGATVTAPEWRQELLAVRASCEVLAGRVEASPALIARVRAMGVPLPRVAARLAAAEAGALAWSGRAEQTTTVVRAALATARDWRDDVPDVLAGLGLARLTARVVAGDLGAAEDLAEAGYRALGDSGTWHTGLAVLAAVRGQICRMRGEVGTAVRWCREAAARFGDAPAGFAGLCFGELAHALALAGDVPAAEEALAEAERRALPTCLAPDFPAVSARAWVRAARGDVDGAVAAALDGAARARANGLAAFEMSTLHDAVRLGAADRAAGRLAVLAGRVDGALAPLYARHAAVAGDGSALAAVSAEYERLGLILYAAEAAAQAAAAHESAGRPSAARAANTRAWRTARRCQGARTPALAAMATPEVTARQRQVIQLVVTGSTNREIAGRLGLSVRTVENHLLRAYERLGVGDRAELADLFGTAGAPAGHGGVT